MKKWITGAAIFAALAVKAQDTIQTSPAPAWSFNAYAETFYSYDLNKPADNKRPGFLYSHNRHNEFNTNLVYLETGYNRERLRASLALAAGTYINANYAAEDGVVKNIFEANIGYKLSNRHNFWFDTGIFPSHIGFESAVSKDCWTVTRSLMAENSPYYESGAKLGYTTGNGKWLLSILALNGWQRIKRVDGNSMMSWGTQVSYKPSAQTTLNYSTFYGTDKPDSARLKRIFHNLYGIFQLSDKWAFTAGFDFGMEQKEKGSRKMNTWYSPVGILRFTPGKQWAFSLRGEYYQDKNSVIISTGTANGFNTSGISVNADFMPLSNLSLRMETRWLKSRDAIFIKDGNPRDNSTAVTFSAAISI